MVTTTMDSALRIFWMFDAKPQVVVIVSPASCPNARPGTTMKAMMHMMMKRRVRWECRMLSLPSEWIAI
jgi:hypothetical protein